MVELTQQEKHEKEMEEIHSMKEESKKVRLPSLERRLKVMKDTYVATPTKNQFELYLTVAETSGWKWMDGQSPVNHILMGSWLWDDAKESTGVSAGYAWPLVNHPEERLVYRDINSSSQGIKVLSDKEFYSIQGIEEATLESMKIYLDSIKRIRHKYFPLKKN